MGWTSRQIAPTHFCSYTLALFHRVTKRNQGRPVFNRLNSTWEDFSTSQLRDLKMTVSLTHHLADVVAVGNPWAQRKREGSKPTGSTFQQQDGVHSTLQSSVHWDNTGDQCDHRQRVRAVSVPGLQQQRSREKSLSCDLGMFCFSRRISIELVLIIFVLQSCHSVSAGPPFPTISLQKCLF